MLKPTFVEQLLSKKLKNINYSFIFLFFRHALKKNVTRFGHSL